MSCLMANALNELTVSSFGSHPMEVPSRKVDPQLRHTIDSRAYEVHDQEDLFPHVLRIEASCVGTLHPNNNSL
jgi:hypothetical protein